MKFLHKKNCLNRSPNSSDLEIPQLQKNYYKKPGDMYQMALSILISTVNLSNATLPKGQSINCNCLER